MLLLLVDTSGPSGGVLLAKGQEDNLHGNHAGEPAIEILGECELHRRQFSAELIPAIAMLLSTTDRRLADLDAFAAVSGPGSFTGLRVGLSAVKALAEATGKPILTLSRLAVMASTATRLAPTGIGEDPVHIVLDAGRGEFYHGLYRDAGKTRLDESFDTLDVLAQKIDQQPGPLVVSEESVKRAFHSVGQSRLFEVPALSVRDALPLALEEWRARRLHDPVSVDANYLRRSDAVVVIRTKSEPIVQAARAEDGP